MKLELITDKSLYDKYVYNNDYGHYMKTSFWANLKTGFIPYFLGFYDNDKLVGTALALKNKGLNKYLYIPYGMCLNYQDLTLLKEALTLLKEFAIKEKVNFLRIDPNVIRVSRDINGNQTDKINNEIITYTIKSANFKHKGYGYAYNGSFTNRYTLMVDLSDDIESIKAKFAKSRQTALNRHQIIGVNTRLGSKKDLNYLMQFEKELSAIQGFKPHSYNFFNAIVDNFKNNLRIYITEIDLNKMIAGINQELNSKKYAKDIEARQAKEKELLQAHSLLKNHGEKLVIAAGMFIYLNDKSWDLYTYNRKSCNFIKPVDNLHYFAMNDMKKLGVKKYDMCGFSGSTDKKDPYYGLYNYKKSFGAEFIEMIGEFDFIIHSNKYYLLNKLKKNINKVNRKVIKLIFQNKSK